MATTFFKSSRVLFLFLVICSALPSKAQKIDSVRVFLDSALNIMERKSIYGQDLNWKVIKDSAHQLAKDAATYQEAGPALKFAFNLLRDKHGWLTLNGEHYANPFMLHDNSRINESTKAALSKPAMRFRSQVVAKKYAYLSIPFFGGQTAEGMNKFAQQVQDSLCKVMGPSIKGIIIDLRLNGGGNVFPMIVGISNVLGDGRFTASVNAAGETEPGIPLVSGKITLLDTMVIQLKKTCGNLQKLPVAVLIGPVTGSSGEQLAIILSVRKNTILIGEPTAGYVSANNGCRLPGNENGIVIGESFTKDILGNVYKDDVQPSLFVKGGDDFSNLEKDKKIITAMDWLAGQLTRRPK